MSFYAYGGRLHSQDNVLRKLNGGFIWIFDTKTKRDKYVKEDRELNRIEPLNALKFMHNFNIEYAKEYMEEKGQHYATFREVVHVESMYEYIMYEVFGLEVRISGEWEPDF